MRFRPSMAMVALALLVSASLIRVPYVLVTPGPAYSTIGEIDGQQFITIPLKRLRPEKPFMTNRFPKKKIDYKTLKHLARPKLMRSGPHLSI